MAVKQILVGKAGSSATPLTLIKGDSNTQIIEMIVERYYGGVDLTPLAWSVTVENANGASDEYRGIEAIANGTNIAVRWKVTGTATAVPGIVKFKLSGYAQDGSDVLIWQSGDYFIRVNDTFEHVPGAETQAALTEVQKLIIYVDGELNKVIKAGNDAAEAAKAANKAADRANSVADGKNEGRITALEQFTTKPEEPYAVEGKLVQLDNFEGMPMNAVTRIEPVQAGSGDPYPGGGGKNLLNYDLWKTVKINDGTAVWQDNGVILTANNADCYTRYSASEFPCAIPVNMGDTIVMSWEHSGAEGLVYIFGNGGTSSMTNVYSSVKTLKYVVPDGITFITIRLSVQGTGNTATYKNIQVEKGTTATAYTPYSNIRPITGHTEAKLTKCGKNLAEQIVYGFVTLDGNNAYVRIDNNSTSVIAGVVEGNEYTISCNATLDRFGVGKLEAANPTNGALLTGYRFYGNQSSAHELHFIAEFTGTAFIYLKSTKDETAKDSLQVEIGSVATEYTPYQGETFTANFGQNVYGGTLDWGKGVLTVDRAMVTLTGTENSVERNTTENAHYIRYNYFGLTQSAIADGAFCSHFKTRLNTDVGDQLTNTFEIHSSILYPIFRVSASLYPTDDVWKSYLAAQKAAGTPVQVCYKLATPTTIQLTPAQLTALQGMNNIFCDAGETTVSGRKDILWLTSGLIEQIDTLKKAIISLGGTV